MWEPVSGPQTWHVIVLFFALALLLSAYERVMNSSWFTQFAVMVFVIYMIYALVADVMDRIKNPKWPSSST